MAIDLRCNRRRSFARTPSLSLQFLTAGAVLLSGQAAQAQSAGSGTAAPSLNVNAPPTGGVAQPGNGGAPRDPWRFTPSLSVDETYSDNINLSTKGAERSDFVSTITPSLLITRYGPRFTLNFTYQPSLLYYARGSNGSQVRNFLSTNGTAAIVENFLFFDAMASIYQSNVSPFGTQAANSVNGSNNRAETRTYSIGPRLKSRLDNDLTYAAGLNVQGSSADSTALTTSHTTQAYGNFDTGTSTRNIAYGGSVNRTDQDYGAAGSILVEQIENHLTYLYSPTLRATVSVGYDKNSYPTSGQPDLKGVSWSTGFDWNPSQRTSLSVRGGKRYFGPTANVNFTQSSNRFSIQATYSRDQTTSTGSGTALTTNSNYTVLDFLLASSIPDPVQRDAYILTLLQAAGLQASKYGTTGFISNQLLLQKRFNVSLALNGLRNTVVLSAFRTDSQALSNINTEFEVLDQANRIRQTGYTASWSHKLGPRTDVTSYVTQTHNEAVIGSGDTKQIIVSASINRQLQKNLSATITLRHTQQTSEGDPTTVTNNPLGSFFASDYRENQVLGSLRLTF